MMSSSLLASSPLLPIPSDLELIPPSLCDLELIPPPLPLSPSNFLRTSSVSPVDRVLSLISPVPSNNSSEVRAPLSVLGGSGSDTEELEEEDEELVLQSEALSAYALARFTDKTLSPSKVLGSSRTKQSRDLLYASKRASRLGSGAQGSVVATDSPLKRNVLAIKVSSQAREALFCRQVLAARNIPHSVHVLDSYRGSNFARSMIIMEKLETDLSGYMKGQSLTPHELKRGFRQILESFSAMKGIVHGDVKPDNFLVSKRKNELVELKLTDFGVARLIDSSPTRYIQTTCYRAPEVYFCKAHSEATDHWGLGCTLFFLVTGEHLMRIPAQRRDYDVEYGMHDSDGEDQLDIEYRAEITEIMQIAYHLGGLSKDDLLGYFQNFRGTEFTEEDIDAYFELEKTGKYFPRFGAFYDARAIRKLKQSWNERLEVGFEKNAELKKEPRLKAKVQQIFGQLMRLDPTQRVKPSEILSTFYPEEEACVSISLAHSWVDNTPIIVSIKHPKSDKVQEIRMSLLALPKCNVHVSLPEDALESFEVSVRDLRGRVLVQGSPTMETDAKILYIARSVSGEFELSVRNKEAPKRKMERVLFGASSSSSDSDKPLSLSGSSSDQQVPPLRVPPGGGSAKPADLGSSRKKRKRATDQGKSFRQLKIQEVFRESSVLKLADS